MVRAFSEKEEKKVNWIIAMLQKDIRIEKAKMLTTLPEKHRKMKPAKHPDYILYSSPA